MIYKKVTLSYLLLFFSYLVNFAQNSEKAIIIKNYNNWGWDSVYVLQNKYLSIATVPEAGGRILEHNLGSYPSLWTNPDLFGQSFQNSDKVKANEWRNFGGYRIVPMPRNNWCIDKDGNTQRRWPPPVVWGDAPYQAQIINEGDIQYVEITSGIQPLPIPFFDRKSKLFIEPEQIQEQIQYKRRVHIIKGTSLAVLKHTVINKGANTIKRGFMTSSQHISRSKPELEDGINYRAYIPFSPKHKLPNGKQFHNSATPNQRWRFVNNKRMLLDKGNPDHVKRFFNSGTSFLGETTPGVYEIHYDYYLMAGFDMIASDAWVCYVDKINHTAFAKILEPYNPNLDYPDGVNLSVFNSGVSTGYLETEVRSPIHTLESGNSFDYTEIIGAAKINNTPILEINKTGIITRRMELTEDGTVAKGDYGVFIEGKAIVQLRNKKGKIVKAVTVDKVDPLHSFSLIYSIPEVENIHKIVLLIQDTNKQLHVLDEIIQKK